MRAEERRVVEKLVKAGIEFSAAVSAPGGAETIPLEGELVLAYLDDWKAVAAAYYRLEVEEYELWVALDGRAMCGERTRSGAPCKNPVSGRIQLSAFDWLMRHGDPCAVHGGETSADAR